MCTFRFLHVLSCESDHNLKTDQEIDEDSTELETTDYSIKEIIIQRLFQKFQY